MKCIVAVVMMALAFAASEASWAPLAYSAYHASPLAYTVPHATYVQQTLGAPVAYSAAYAPAPLSYAYQSSVVPTAYAYQPAVAVVAQKEARYLAANRGAVHDAPLPGHTVSQQSLNLEPAAGTL